MRGKIIGATVGTTINPNKFVPGGVTVTDEQVASAVEKYLEEHPEATTTVQDESISEEKLTAEVRAKLNSGGKDGRGIDHIEDPGDGTMEIYYTDTVDTDGIDVIKLPAGSPGKDGRGIDHIEDPGDGTMEIYYTDTVDTDGIDVIKLPAGNADGLSDTAKALLITILRNGVYSTDQSANITALEKALAGGEVPDIPDEPDVPVNPEVTLVSIIAIYSGGDVAIGTALDKLTGVVVKAVYSDGSTATVTDYTLSGTIAEGSNTITVSYGGKTTTFTVTGVEAEDSEELMCDDNIVAENLSIKCLAQYSLYDVAATDGSNIYAIPVEQGVMYEASITEPNQYGIPYWDTSKITDMNGQAHFAVSDTILTDFSVGRHNKFTFDGNATVDNSTTAKKINNGDGTYTSKIYFTPAVSGYIHASNSSASYVYSIKKVVA